MMHTFEEICTRTPANPNEAAPEAATPQAASEALLWDAVQAPRPPYTPETLRRWLQTTYPQAWATGAPQPPPPHATTTTPGRERAKGGPAARGRGEAQGSRQAPTGTGHLGRHNTGARNHQKGQEKEGPGAVAQSERAQRRAPGRTHRKGTPQRKDHHRPTPSRHRPTPGDARPPVRTATART